MQAAVPESARPLPVMVVCNKTDATPCPLPQIAALHDQWPFIAVSAERSTNVRLLWEMVCSRLKSAPAAGCSTAPLLAARPSQPCVATPTTMPKPKCVAVARDATSPLPFARYASDQLSRKL